MWIILIVLGMLARALVLRFKIIEAVQGKILGACLVYSVAFYRHY